VQQAATIRPATANDATVLHDIAAETFPLACPPDALPESVADFIATHLSQRSFAEYLADSDRALRLASVGHEEVGYAMVVFGEPHDSDAAACITTRPTAELSKLYVRAGYHGAGVAAALLSCVVDVARARGARGLWLGTNQQNDRANRFYAKSGFIRRGTKRFLVGARYEDDFVWELVLDV
jgi:GNAT superfamily N-acetyltransferase